VDPLKRMTVKEALNHPWISTEPTDSFNKKLSVAENIKKNFTAKQKFKATVEAIKAAGRMALLFSPSNANSQNSTPNSQANQAEKNAAAK